MEKLKFGEFEETISKVEPGDLEMEVSGGIIIRACMGSLLWLREYLHDIFGGGALVYYTHSSKLLYLAKWHELSSEKQNEIKSPRRR